MDLSFEEWLLIGLLALIIVLVCLGAADYYGERPEYPPTHAPRGKMSRHSQEDNARGTQRLTPPPKCHPRDM